MAQTKVVGRMYISVCSQPHFGLVNGAVRLAYYMAISLAICRKSFSHSGLVLFVLEYKPEACSVCMVMHSHFPYHMY